MLRNCPACEADRERLARKRVCGGGPARREHHHARECRACEMRRWQERSCFGRAHDRTKPFRVKYSDKVIGVLGGIHLAGLTYPWGSPWGYPQGVAGLPARETAETADDLRNPAVSRFRGSATRNNGATASGEPPLSPLKWIPPKRIYRHLRRGDPRLRPTSLHQPSCLGSRIRMCSPTVRPRSCCPHSPHHFP
jgi:hypothetical protein